MADGWQKCRGYPLGDASRMGCAASLRADLAGDRVLKLEELVDRRYLRRGLWQAELVRKSGSMVVAELSILRKFDVERSITN